LSPVYLLLFGDPASFHLRGRPLLEVLTVSFSSLLNEATDRSEYRVRCRFKGGPNSFDWLSPGFISILRTF
jgi:hypothetical protein